MENFSAQGSKDFLISGFQQIGVAVSSEVVDYAVENLDGTAGWLTLFGSRCLTKHSGSKEIVDEVASEAGRLAREEAVKLTVMSKRYGVILNFLAGVGSAGWVQVKSAIQAKEGHSLTSSPVSKLLNMLVKSGFIQKTDDKYAITDLLMVKGIKEEALPE
jgi:AAA+ ATPase superfamily predicted ATPase